MNTHYQAYEEAKIIPQWEDVLKDAFNKIKQSKNAQD